MSETGVESFLDESAGEERVRGFLHRPGAPNGNGLVLTHGAGGNCESPLLAELAAAFSRAGWLVLRCDLPFRQARPSGPPPRGSSDRDQAGLRRAAALLRKVVSGPVAMGGQSYGGRQATLLEAADPSAADALLLLSYPLHPPRSPSQLRTAHFPRLVAPALFVHGTRDPFGSLDEMAAAIKLIPAPTKLLPIQGEGHSLWSRPNRSELPEAIVAAFRELKPESQ